MSVKYKDLVCTLLLGFYCSTSVYGMSSPPTLRIVGHKPIATNVKIDNNDPVFGDKLVMSYQYSDVDNDTATVPVITWYYNGKEVRNQTQVFYQPIFDPVTGEGVECTDVRIQVGIVPRSKSGDPKIGDKVMSTETIVKVSLGYIPGYIKPTTATFKWADADAYCRSKGARLPTVVELQQLFKDYTTSSNSYEMSSNYGWPMQLARCGGSSNSYWSSDSKIMPPYGERHYDVSLFDGSEFIAITDNSPYHVACKID